MIDTITFKNYKIFKERQTIKLKPISILIGKNNSGKSAIAKLPTLIGNSLATDFAEPIILSQDDIELGSELRDLVYGKSLRVLEFDLEAGQNKLSVGILISQEKTKQSSTVVSWKLNNDINLEDNGEGNKYLDLISNKNSINIFKGFKLIGSSDKSLVEKAIDGVKAFTLKTDFIGPIRVSPLRDYRLPASPNLDKSGSIGENTYLSLIQDALTTDKKLLNDVSKWYKENFEGWELKVNQDKAPLFQIEIHRNDLKQNIVDTGIGMSQVLPIVVRALKRCDEETLVIIEEPETHLHPAAHGNLASLIVESLKQGNKNYLIETHSLNFVLRLRRMIAEGSLKPEELGIYYVDFVEENNFSLVKEIAVDEFGRVNEWPEGVFNETLAETVGIRTAQLENPEYGN